MNAPVFSPDDRPVLDVAITRGADGRSRLVRRRVCYPWSLGRGYLLGGGTRTITIVPQAAGAGLLAGDRFRQQISIGPGASLRFAPAGATLVHGATPSQTSLSLWRYVLDVSAEASIASEPHVLMEDANLVLRQEFVIDHEAALVATEAVVLAPGVSRASWKLETCVLRSDGSTLFIDNQIASADSLHRTGRLPGAFTAFASVLIIAPPHRRKGLARELDRRIRRPEATVWGACAHLRTDAGLGIRLAGRDGGQVRKMALELHDLARHILGM